MANKNISRDLGILSNIIDEKYSIEPTPTPNIYNKVMPVPKPTPPKGFVAPLTGNFAKPTPGPSPIKGELDPDTLKPLPPKGMEEDFGLYELLALPVQLVKEPFISVVKNQMKKIDDVALKQLDFYKNNPPKIDLKNGQIDIKMFVPEAQTSIKKNRELFVDIPKKNRVLNTNIAEPQAWDELKKLKLQPEGKKVPGFKISGQSTKLDLPYPDYIPIWEDPYEFISNKITGFPSLHKSVGKIVEGKNNHAILPITPRTDFYPNFEHYIYKNGKLDVIKNELGKSEPHKLAAAKNGMRIAIDPRTKKILPNGEDLQHMWYEKNGYTTAYIPAPEYQRPGNPIVIIRGDNAKDINDMYMMLNKGIIDEADLVP